MLSSSTSYQRNSRHWYSNPRLSRAFGFLPLVAPAVSALSFGDEPVNAGESAAVQCSVPKGDLPMEIRWSKDGVELKSGDGVQVNKLSSRLSSLGIEPVGERHSGQYTCTASNKAGSESQTAQLDVLGRATSSCRHDCCSCALCIASRPLSSTCIFLHSLSFPSQPFLGSPGARQVTWLC